MIKILSIFLKIFFLKFKDHISLNFEKMNDILKGEIEVLKIVCRDPVYFFKIVSYIRKSNIPLMTEVYNIDLSPVEIFFLYKRYISVFLDRY